MPVLEAHTRELYRGALQAIEKAGVPFLVGGAYAFARYTGIERHTKDFDIFVRPEDCERTLQALRETGMKTELTFPHWLGKAFSGDHFIDVIFSAGNGIAMVDEEWFTHGVADEVLGLPVRLCPPEEMIWSKGMVMERERYDGADIAHVLRAVGRRLDWERLLRRYGSQWRVLLSHLILFGFVYPGERTTIPASVMRELIGRLEAELESDAPSARLCCGTIISREQYLTDVDNWGYADARLKPNGNMTEEDIAHWTAAIQAGK